MDHLEPAAIISTALPRTHNLSLGPPVLYTPVHTAAAGAGAGGAVSF